MTNLSRKRNNNRRSKKKSNLSKKMELFKKELVSAPDKEFVSQFQILIDFYLRNPKSFNLIGDKLNNIFIKN